MSTYGEFILIIQGTNRKVVIEKNMAASFMAAHAVARESHPGCDIVVLYPKQYQEIVKTMEASFGNLGSWIIE